MPSAGPSHPSGSVTRHCPTPSCGIRRTSPTCGRTPSSDTGHSVTRPLRTTTANSEGLDAKQIRRSIKGDYDQFQERLKDWYSDGQEIGLTASEQRKAEDKITGDERKRLGVRDPLGDYAKDS